MGELKVMRMMKKTRMLELMKVMIMIGLMMRLEMVAFL